MTMGTWVYSFGAGQADGTAKMRDLLGGKGANLAEMCNLGLPVPPGFTITTEVCRFYYEHDRRYPEDLAEQVHAALRKIEQTVDARLGDPDRPLLVSVRSGAPISMPGMMDTVLNLGLNNRTVEGLARSTDDARFAYDSYRRFVQMYGDVVLGVDHYLFEDRLEDAKRQQGYDLDTELGADDLRSLIGAYQAIVEAQHGAAFPQNVEEQLWGAIGAVFGSWMTQRAVTYRRLHDIDNAMGTAVTVQAMVFGNRGARSATGVAFTRDPSTGDKRYYGEFLVNAQGEDVVAGIRTPQPLTISMKEATGGSLPAMEEVMPDAFAELVTVFDRLEAHYRDMQDIEFTVQDGRLRILQTRSGKRTTHAALKIAVDMAEEGLIDRDQAVVRINPASLDQLLHPTLDPDAPKEVIAKGLPASPGAVSGKVVFNADDAERMAATGEAVLLVRIETSPEDIHGMRPRAS
jgi:pyruvate, orthophosphate dikinase